MKISIDKNSPFYHDVVHFVDCVTLNGKPLGRCIGVDTNTGMAICHVNPYYVDSTGELSTHVISGKMEIIWRYVGSGQRDLFLALKADWENQSYNKPVVNQTQPSQPTPQ